MTDRGSDPSGIGAPPGSGNERVAEASAWGGALALDGGADTAGSGDSGAVTDDGTDAVSNAGIGAVTDDAIDAIAFLTRSPVRVRVLYVLARRGPVEKRELRKLVDGVRTTVTRNLSALTERGWIEDTPEGYRITGCGEMIVDELVALTESAALAVDLRPALRWLDVDRLDLDLRHFERAEITTADSTNPYAPVEEQVELVRGGTTVRAALPTVNKQILEACRRTASADGGDVTLVLESAAVDRFQSADRYAELFADVCRRATVLEHDGELPYYVGATGDAVQLGTTDGDNVLRVLLGFDDDEVHSWADDRFARFERDAQIVENGL